MSICAGCALTGAAAERKRKRTANRSPLKLNCVAHEDMPDCPLGGHELRERCFELEGKIMSSHRKDACSGRLICCRLAGDGEDGGEIELSDGKDDVAMDIDGDNGNVQDGCGCTSPCIDTGRHGKSESDRPVATEARTADPPASPSTSRGSADSCGLLQPLSLARGRRVPRIDGGSRLQSEERESHHEERMRRSSRPCSIVRRPRRGIIEDALGLAIGSLRTSGCRGRLAGTSVEPWP